MQQDKPQSLYAYTKPHCFLKDGSPMLIGKSYNAIRNLADGSIECQTVLEFHFGSKDISDMFFFEDNRIVFHSFSPFTQTFITEIYKKLAKAKTITPEQFTEEVTKGYTRNMETC